MIKRYLLLSALLLALFISACQPSTADSAADKPAIAPLNQAIAVLSPTEGNATAGVVKFEQTDDEVTITAEVSGLKPNSIHGWHIHEYGDLTSLEGKATGGHYNPGNLPHALPDNPERHAGDLGNLKADETGKAQVELSVNNVSINGDQSPILGRAIIIHAQEDDGGQPTGNAGGRMAQGTIGVRQPL